MDVLVDNARVMRYEPNAISPNVIGGSPANSVNSGVRGATIAGGGHVNLASGAGSNIAGGYNNEASGG